MSVLAVDMAGVAYQGLVCLCVCVEVGKLNGNSSFSRLHFRCRRNHRLMRRTERNRTEYSGKYLPRALENLC